MTGLSDKYHTIRLVLGDQLNANHSWFSVKRSDVLYVLMELEQETAYVTHHIQKVACFFAAMKQFSLERSGEGHHVLYLPLGHSRQSGTLTKNLERLMEEYRAEEFQYQLPDEYRLDEQLKAWCRDSGFITKVFDTEHFLSSRESVATLFSGKSYLMETWYRKVRKQYDILMNGDRPEGGKWNFDKENRKPPASDWKVPSFPLFNHDLTETVAHIRANKVKTIGSIESKHVNWPLSRKEALQLLDWFKQYLLPSFGTYQDAMAEGEPFLFHSRLSFALNTKMLSPLEVVESIENHYRDHRDQIGIAQVEGFIRQIIGWREYMRGIYWAKMPAYARLNELDAERPLPAWFWTGETKMNCLSHCISQSLDHAYAHHIQRLMVTGNFAMLAGIAPDEIDQWYLGIYIDAIEWVEITNTRGMSQYADGGIVGSKPYAASANYINKMSNYCKGCSYDPAKRTGKGACPFNSLYWRFYEVHRDKLENHPRIGFVYRNLNKMNAVAKKEIIQQAEYYLAHLETL